MVTYYTGCQHIDSEFSLKAQRRPFESVHAMKEAFIKSWNEQVQEGDTVELLGDLFDGEVSYNEAVDLLSRLKGTINYTMGNRCVLGLWKELLRGGYINELNTLGKTIYVKDTTVHLTHYPLALEPRINIINIHAHLHSKPSQYLNQFNVSVDSPLLSFQSFFFMMTDEHIFQLLEHNRYVIENYWQTFDNHIFCSEVLQQKHDKKRNII